MVSPKKSILNVGREPAFRGLRHQVLTAAGYQVATAESVRQAEQWADRKVDALVVGAWMNQTERQRLVRLAKNRNPNAKVVFYYDQKIEGTEEADAILNVRGDHEDLVRTLRHLFAKARTKRGGKAKAAQGIAGFFLALVSTVFSSGATA